VLDEEVSEDEFADIAAGVAKIGLRICIPCYPPYYMVFMHVLNYLHPLKRAISKTRQKSPTGELMLRERQTPDRRRSCGRG
jgi:hypothetical protein